MLEEPRRFSWKHWWNIIAAVFVLGGAALWRAGILDGRLVFGGVIAWGLLGFLIVPELIYEHLAFADRWVFRDYAKARSRYRKAVDAGKATAEAHCALGSLTYSEGDFAEACRLLEEAASRLPKDAHLHYLLSRSLSRQGRHEESVSEAIRSGQMSKGDVLGDLALGDALAEKGDLLSAAACYQKALAKRPGLAQAHIGLARCYLALGRPEAAEVEAEEGRRLAPRDPDALYWAGRTAISLNRPKDAARLFQSALDSRPIDDKAGLVSYGQVVAALCQAQEGQLANPSSDNTRSLSS